MPSHLQLFKTSAKDTGDKVKRSLSQDSLKGVGEKAKNVLNINQPATGGARIPATPIGEAV